MHTYFCVTWQKALIVFTLAYHYVYSQILNFSWHIRHLYHIMTLSWVLCRFEDHLGVGQFGSVSRATWTNEEGGKKVAVKTLKPTMLTPKKVKFLQEAAIMGQFFHSNVIRLFGVVTVGEPVSKG